MKGRGKRLFLVATDYGQGGVWGYVRAHSEDEIKLLFPEVDIVRDVPQWMTRDMQEDLLDNAEDIEGPFHAILAAVLLERERNDRR